MLKNNKIENSITTNSITMTSGAFNGDSGNISWSGDITPFDEGDLVMVSDCSTSYKITIGELYTNEIQKLKEFEEKETKDVELRKQYPALQEVYEEYQLIKKLLEDF